MSPHAVTAFATPQAVQRVQAVAGFELFTMIDQQAGLVVKLVKILGEVLQGKESAHSLRLHDLEQRREELQRRYHAATGSMPDLNVGVDEFRWTMEMLDRVAAGLFRTARGGHQILAGQDEATSELVASIHKAAVSLRHGYARLANGSPAAEFNAEAAMAGTSPGRGFRFCELHGNLIDIACELGRAAVVLKGWSRQLASGLPEARLRADTHLTISQQLEVN